MRFLTGFSSHTTRVSPLCALVVVHVIGMRVARKIQNTPPAMRTEVVMPLGPNCQERALHAKTVAIFAE